MYGQTENQEKQKKKIILVSCIMGIIIIVLIGVLINNISAKNKARKESEETALVREDEQKEAEPTKVEETPKEETKTEDAKAEEPKAEETKLEPVSNEVKPSSEVKSDNLPKTGASSILGLALLAGSATTFVFSRKNRA